jgi:hypothetical protein
MGKKPANIGGCKGCKKAVKIATNTAAKKRIKKTK